MKKIPTLFIRDWQHQARITPEIEPEVAWVAAGEGRATRKYDGTCVMFRSGELFKRYDAKKGKTPPAGFEPAMEPDPVTGHFTGWLPVVAAPENWMHLAALAQGGEEPDGTYELVGSAINGNPEKMLEGQYRFLKHGDEIITDCPTDYHGLRSFLEHFPHEGIVWHHLDGRMAKIKRKDFWP